MWAYEINSNEDGAKQKALPRKNPRTKRRAGCLVALAGIVLVLALAVYLPKWDMIKIADNIIRIEKMPSIVFF